MKETKNEKVAEDEVVWPPTPTNQVENAKVARNRYYLTNHGWLDTIVGIGGGSIFYWFVFYAGTGCVQYLIPHQADYFWNVVASCIIALFVMLIFWSRLRLFYQRLANTMLCAGIFEGLALTYFFY